MTKPAVIATLIAAVLAAGAGAHESGPASQPAKIEFQGWLRMTDHALTEPGGAPIENEEEAAPVIYVNKSSPAMAVVSHFAGRTVINWKSAAQKEIAEYDSETGLIRLGCISDFTAEKIRQSAMGQFVLLDDFIAGLKAGGSEIMSLEHSQDGKLRRTDISYVGGSACAGLTEGVARDSFWSDPETGLVHKMQRELPDPRETVFTYGAKVDDIYDLGAPKASKVVDSRPAPEAAKVLDRLDRRFHSGFGATYTALLAETDHREQWGSRKMFLHLHSEDRDAGIYAIYAFREDDYPDSPMLGIQGWPKPTMDHVLELAKTTVPLLCYSGDGKTAWNARFAQTPDVKTVLVEQEQPFEENPPKLDYLIESHIWQGRDKLFLYGFGPQVDLTTDEKRPGILGLRLRFGDFSQDESPAGSKREEKVFWIDPSRDDVPVEAHIRSERFGGDARHVIEKHVEYLDYAKLENGPWYPTHWQAVSSSVGGPGQRNITYTREFHLQLAPGKALDTTWYGSCQKRLQVNGVDLAGKPQP